VATLLTRRPLSSVGFFFFDSQISESRGQSREFSVRRIPSGGNTIDHSVLDRGGRRFTVSGRVCDIQQVQNLGRPRPIAALDDLDQQLNRQALAAAGQIVGLSSRVRDQEALLSAEIASGAVIKCVAKKFGKIQAVVTAWDVDDGADDGGASTYSIELLEISIAEFRGALGLPSETAESLGGGGNLAAKGPSNFTTKLLELVP